MANGFLVYATLASQLALLVYWVGVAGEVDAAVLLRGPAMPDLRTGTHIQATGDVTSASPRYAPAYERIPDT